jgi:hypothetical protein
MINQITMLRKISARWIVVAAFGLATAPCC